MEKISKWVCITHTLHPNLNLTIFFILDWKLTYGRPQVFTSCRFENVKEGSCGGNDCVSQWVALQALWVLSSALISSSIVPGLLLIIRFIKSRKFSFHIETSLLSSWNLHQNEYGSNSRASLYSGTKIQTVPISYN